MDVYSVNIWMFGWWKWHFWNGENQYPFFLYLWHSMLSFPRFITKYIANFYPFSQICKKSLLYQSLINRFVILHALNLHIFLFFIINIFRCSNLAHPQFLPYSLDLTLFHSDFPLFFIILCLLSHPQYIWCGGDWGSARGENCGCILFLCR